MCFKKQETRNNTIKKQKTGFSSDGRAVDCSGLKMISTCRWFDSSKPENTDTRIKCNY